jgi:hypothetical protein
MSAQFAIGSVNRMAHISKADYGLGCNGFCVACNKSLVAKHEDTNELHFFASITVRLACDRTFRQQKQIIPFWTFLKFCNVKANKASRVLCTKTATFRSGQPRYFPLVYYPLSLFKPR